MAILQEGMMRLYEEGIVDIILPFILVFTIVFAILQKTKVLGEENGKPRKNFNSVIALVMGLAVVFPHILGLYPPGGDVVDIINRALPNVSVILVAIVMLMLMIGIWGNGVQVAGTSVAGWVVLISVIVIFVIFAAAAEWVILPQWLGFVLDRDTQALIVVILIFALIIWFVTREEKEKKAEGPSLLEQLGKTMK